MRRSVRLDGQLRRLLIHLCCCHGFDTGPFHQAHLLRHFYHRLHRSLADPVEVLFGVQLGSGTDINAALAYCERQIENPAKTHLVLITDLYEGGDANSLLARDSAIKQSGVHLAVLLPLSDAGHPAYEPKHAGALASFACPVFACTPDQFPSMMAAALTGKDLHTGVRTKRRSHPGILRASCTYLEEKWTCLWAKKSRLRGRL